MKISHPLIVSRKIFAARVTPPPQPLDVMEIDRVKGRAGLSPAEEVYTNLSFSEAMLFLPIPKRAFFDSTYSGAGEDLPEVTIGETPLTRALFMTHSKLHLFTACLDSSLVDLKVKLFGAARELLNLSTRTRKDSTDELPVLRVIQNLLQEFQLEKS